MFCLTHESGACGDKEAYKTVFIEQFLGNTIFNNAESSLARSPECTQFFFSAIKPAHLASFIVSCHPFERENVSIL